LYADEDWFYPIIDGIPRLIVEAFLDYEDFFRRHLPDYAARRSRLETGYTGFINYVRKKNRRTKASFSQEWGLHDYGTDRTWRLDKNGMLQTFLNEVDEPAAGLKGKTILDAGCGNGQLDTLIAQQGATVVAMDLSLSIERAYMQNTHPGVCYLQGDVQFPPLAFAFFDIVHSSGVIHHTNNTELSFSCLSPCVASGGKLSVWLYRPRKNFLHRLFNRMRALLSPLPPGWLYFLLRCTIFHISWSIKRTLCSRQNSR
jgi:SAM-dependent methyltransferase